MSKVRSLFLSDLHLGTPDCHADELLQFLGSVEADNIFLIGDVLDLTSLRRRACWPAQHSEVLALLCRRARAGVRVVYLPGNHDAALRDLIGLFGGAIELHADLLHTSASGARLLLVHGDCFESRVHCSRALAWVGSIAYDATLAVTRWLNRLRRALRRPEWALVSALKRRLPVALRYIAEFEAAAVAAARRAGADGVICGHIHVPRLARHEAIVYANTGDWVESCSALIEECDGSLKLWRGTVVAESLGYDRHALPAVTGA